MNCRSAFASAFAAVLLHCGGSVQVATEGGSAPSSSTEAGPVSSDAPTSTDLDATVADANRDAAPEEGLQQGLDATDAPPDAPPAVGCPVSGAGLTDCDPGGAESCCTSLDLPAGTYYRTFNTAGSTAGPPDGGWADLADPATVSGFRLDKYLVTVGRFRQFVNAVYRSRPDGGTGWRPPARSGKHTHLNGGQGLVNARVDAGVAYETGWLTSDDGNIAPTDANLGSCNPWSTWTSTAGSQENLPINCVNWWEAYAFCIWDGGFLPSEAEWGYAAAAGSEQREYPWGSTAPGTANQYAIYEDGTGNCYFPGGAPCTSATNVAPVGTATSGQALWGQLDLAGNVWEWTMDWYAPFVGPCVDCAYLTAAAEGRVMRGGSFYAPEKFLLASSRTSAGTIAIPDRYGGLGLRCARSP